MSIKFLRPMGFTTLTDAHFASDAPLAQNIASWCGKIALGGNPYDLKVGPQDVYQLSSTRLNWHTFGVSVEDHKLVRNIVLSTQNRERDLENKIGGKLAELDIAGGILVLHRRISQRATAQEADALLAKLKAGDKRLDPKLLGKGWNPRRFIVEDSYHLDVYCKGHITPVLKVYDDSLGAVHVRMTADEIMQKNASLPEYFPTPDDVIVSWHQLAQVLKLQRTRLYLQACFAAAGFKHSIYGYNGTPAPAGTSPHAIGAELLFRNPPYTEAELSTPGFVIPSGEATKTYTNFLMTTLHFVPPDRSDLPSEFSVSTPVDGLPYTYDILREIPQPSIDQSLESKAAIRFLQQQSKGIAEYLAGDYFRMRSADLTTLAAGTGNWGSPEWAILYVGAEISIKSVAGGTSAVGAVLAAAGAIWDLCVDEQAELNDCYNNSSSKAECYDCVGSSSATGINSLQAAGGIVTSIAGAIALLAGWTGWGAIIAGVMYLGGFAMMAVAAEDIYTDHKECEQHYD